MPKFSEHQDSSLFGVILLLAGFESVQFCSELTQFAQITKANRKFHIENQVVCTLR